MFRESLGLEAGAVRDIQARWVDGFVVTCKVVTRFYKGTAGQVHTNGDVHAWHHFRVTRCVCIVNADCIEANTVATEPVITGSALVVTRDLAERDWNDSHITALDQSNTKCAYFIALLNALNRRFIFKVEDVLAGTITYNGLIRIVGTNLER